MPPPPSPPAPSGEPPAIRLALLYTVVFVEIGIAMPFMPVWLNALQLDAGLIGGLLALPIAIRIVATAPLMGLIDRGVSARALLLAGSLVLAATYALMPAAAGLGWGLLAGLIAINAVAAAPLVPSIDYLTLAAVRRSKKLDYARIRLCGSVGFLAANLAGGAILGALGEAFAVPLLLTALALVAAGVAFASRGVAPAAAPRPRSAARPRLPRVLWLAIGAGALVQSSHAAIYAFGSISWSSAGVPGAWIGALWAIGVAAEILLFAVIGRLPAPWRSPFRLLGLGAAAALVRALGMALAGDSLPALVALQMLHGFSFGATHFGVMNAVSGLAPDGARGRAQGTVSSATALASALATLGCGVVYRSAGPAATFLAMAPLALTGLCLVGVAARAARGTGVE
ncbi:MFS transporter [Methylobacterium haplocladii]|uniref:MFS transporter n=1 Tax=Methylobacterium haplocladii TaxID=1176176 RepID=A0A512IQK9_9HYPH|nr:MFS transporter [Methylobacterium haplocladii]GEP00002.1 MFS transporter [Methylobacterium haplocladii]GJD86493.1 putative 3-phenylpropionic acid transporter [Methylobacterium haplocladii]